MPTCWRNLLKGYDPSAETINFFITFTRMKVFSSIWAVYMMALFLMPCADKLANETRLPDDYAHALPDHAKHDHSQSADSCSPFCLCNCCGKITGVVLGLPALSTFDLKILEIIKPHSQYISGFIPYYVGEIWQPPQLNS